MLPPCARKANERQPKNKQSPLTASAIRRESVASIWTQRTHNVSTPRSMALDQKPTINMRITRNSRARRLSFRRAGAGAAGKAVSEENERARPDAASGEATTIVAGSLVCGGDRAGPVVVDLHFLRAL